MSFFGVDLRNSVAIGLGGIISLFSGRGNDQALGDLLTEDNNNLVQEDGGLILLE
jgi:glycerate kinase